MGFTSGTLKHVPRVVDIALPPQADHVLEVLSGRPAMAVLLALAKQPDATAQRELSVLTGLSAQTTSDALRRLEDAGVVHASVPRDERRGRSGTWTLDHAAVGLLLSALADMFTPHPPENRNDNACD